MKGIEPKVIRYTLSFCSILSCTILVVSTGSHSWMTRTYNSEYLKMPMESSLGLFKVCMISMCANMPEVSGWFLAVRLMMISACMVPATAFSLFLIHTFKHFLPKRFIPLLFATGGIMTILAVSLFTVKQKFSVNNYVYGWSYATAWLSVPISLLTAGLALYHEEQSIQVLAIVDTSPSNYIVSHDAMDSFNDLNAESGSKVSRATATTETGM